VKGQGHSAVQHNANCQL